MGSRFAKLIKVVTQRAISVRMLALTDRQFPHLSSALRRHWARRSVRDRYGGWGVTFGLLSMIYVFAAWSDVSPSEYAARIITFTSVSMPASASSSAAPAAPSEAPTPVPEVTLPTRTEITLSPSTGLTRASLREPRRSIDGAAAVSRQSISTPSVLNTPEVRARVTSPGIRRRTPVEHLSARMTLPGTRPTLEREDATLQLPVPAQSAPEIRHEIDAPEVRVFDETTLTTEDARTVQIIDWVRQNPTEIPPVIKRHMDYLAGDYVSMASTTINGEPVDLFLLVRGGYSQLHVLMVSGENSYLFYDRGMQGEVSRFRVGRVSRTGAEVARIVSQEREITSFEAQQFYTAFLEWWERQAGE